MTTPSLPPNFKQMIVECTDPYQSIDTLAVGGRTLPVQVACIGLEKKINRLAVTHQDHELMIMTSVAAITSSYDKTLHIDWLNEHVSFDEAEAFYMAHIHRLSFNDEIEAVVDQVEAAIEWKPINPETKEESKRYQPSQIFLPLFVYMNVIENTPAEYIFNHMTRGYLAVVRLNNMISADRMRPVDKEAERAAKASKKMSAAQTADDFMAGLASQGFGVGDIF